MHVLFGRDAQDVGGGLVDAVPDVVNGAAQGEYVVVQLLRRRGAGIGM